MGRRFVIRLLDQSSGVVTLQNPACPDEMRHSISDLLRRPQGMLVVTRTDRERKDNDLICRLSNHMKSETRNIVTSRRPVEYKIEGITIIQIQVYDDIGQEFANILRLFFGKTPM